MGQSSIAVARPAWVHAVRAGFFCINSPSITKKFVTTIKPVEITPENTSLKTKRTVQAKIDVKKINVAIRSVKPIKNGGIIVETISEEDLDKLIYEFKAKDELTKEYQIGKPATRNPHIICFEVSPETKSEVLTESLRNQFLEENEEIE
ncbi:hypothetical protein CEXT_736921 [Caerostris extrusa]|uniref:Uncharacterized protein n=1 Tax=Caerostris extrusa TaxID=172846 RepID=A0AAV4MPY6_CAEEX|nr:hypothetical protein CEXT_736921 [Caerostris extrusa]